jgi:hypothetical protein
MNLFPFYMNGTLQQELGNMDAIQLIKAFKAHALGRITTKDPNKLRDIIYRGIEKQANKGHAFQD